MRSLFATVIWGDEYVRDFLDMCVPTLLAPGNLPAAEAGSVLLLLTPKEDEENIRRDPAFAALCEAITVEFLTISMPRGRNKYFHLSRVQTRALKYASEFDVIFFLYPDFFLANGVIKNALQRLDDGYQGVVTPVPRITEKKVRLKIKDIRESTSRAVVLEPRVFTRVAMECLHPTMYSYEWGGSEMSTYPSTLLWRAGEDGYLFRCFHLHPLALKVQNHDPLFWERFRGTLDEEYLPRLFPEIDGLYYPSDSEEIAVCSVSPEEFDVPRLLTWQKPNVLFMARWAEGATFTLHRQFALHPYRWHCRDVPPQVWETVEKASSEKIKQILRRLAIPDTRLKVEDPVAYRARQNRLRRFKHCARRPERVPPAVDSVPTNALLVVIGARIAYQINAYALARKIWHLLRGCGGAGECSPNRNSISIVANRMTENIALHGLLLEVIRRLGQRGRSRAA